MRRLNLRWMLAFVAECCRVSPPLTYAGGLEVPSSSLGAPIKCSCGTEADGRGAPLRGLGALPGFVQGSPIEQREGHGDYEE
jgi:hypothetical protein